MVMPKVRGRSSERIARGFLEKLGSCRGAVKAVREMLQFGVRACDETLKILGEESG